MEKAARNPKPHVGKAGLDGGNCPVEYKKKLVATLEESFATYAMIDFRPPGSNWSREGICTAGWGIASTGRKAGG